MYCTLNDVKEFTAFKEEDFGLVNPGSFDTMIEKLITQADVMINRDRGRTFNTAGADAELAPLLQNISMRITANAMIKAVDNRTLPVDKIDNASRRIDLLIPQITDDIKADLRRLPGGARFAMGIVRRRWWETEADRWTP